MGQKAKLIICSGQSGIEQYPLAETVYLGRKEEGSPAEIQIDCPFAAELHGKLLKEEGRFVYKDLGTKYGTYYNDEKVGSRFTDDDNHVKLEDGDVLRIDDTQFGTVDAQAAILIYRDKFEEETEWRSFSLEDRRRNYYLSCREESEGEEVAETELPEHYAVMRYDGSHWRVEEHNTKYGVYVNGVQVKGSCTLKFLDVVRIGETLFLFQGDRLCYNHHEASKHKLVIHIEERSVWNLFRKRLLLKDIDLTIRPKEMVMVLGGSGAGKTTFFNAVMGYEKAQGSVSKDGVDIYKNYDSMKYEIGYVPQQDWLRLEDTVKDTLANAAELKLPVDVSEEERRQRVEEVLELFGLEREAESLVGKLSGGQRKRLSIAVEYIADPGLFFLDEPDSGLDGVMARHLMESLRQIADQDKTVLVITHSPDRVIDLFDRVIVLAKGNEDNIGHLAFYGTPHEARTFFEVNTMEEVILKINRTDEGGEGMADYYIKKYKELEEK